jgi:hypothetical protein
VDRVGAGPYKAVKFSVPQLREIRYAGLLHDFGKVGVREQVLVKQKKLYPSDLDIIRHRFAYLLQAADLQYERERANYLAMHGEKNYNEAATTATSRRSRPRSASRSSRSSPVATPTSRPARRSSRPTWPRWRPRAPSPTSSARSASRPSVR